MKSPCPQSWLMPLSASRSHAARALQFPDLYFKTFLDPTLICNMRQIAPVPRRGQWSGTFSVLCLQHQGHMLPVRCSSRTRTSK